MADNLEKLFEDLNTVNESIELSETLLKSMFDSKVFKTKDFITLVNMLKILQATVGNLANISEQIIIEVKELKKK